MSMARIVKRTATEPARFVIDGKGDGSHKLTRGELPGKLYWYDEAGERREALGEFPNIRTF
jgi:hypothetical protein